MPRLPAAWHGRAEPVAASRFLATPASGAQELLSGPQRATLARLRAQAVVLLGQDPTVLDDGTTQPKQGLGTVTITVHEAERLHPPVAVTLARLHLGVVGLKGGQRPAPPGAHERHRPPLPRKSAPGGGKGISGRARASPAVQRRSA